METSPRVLAVLPGLIPSTLLCVVKPLSYLHSAGKLQARITLESVTRSRDLAWADLVVFCRNCGPLYECYREFLVERRIPYIYDIDDNLFALPANSKLAQDLHESESLRVLETYLCHADLVRVYSQPMLEQVRIFNKNVQLVDPPIDWDVVLTSRTASESGKIKVVYATSRMEDELASIFLPALIRLLKEYPHRVEAFLLGCRPDFNGCRNVHYRPFLPNYDRFMRKFSRVGYDIGLAPLHNDLFHRSKTNNKFREYAACCIAGVYSNVDVYSQCVRDGETGLLVSNESDAWYLAIRRLIEDDQLRERIRDQALAYVKARYSYEKFLDTWLSQAQNVLMRRGEKLNYIECPRGELSQVHPRRSFLHSGLKWLFMGLGKALVYLRSGDRDSVRTGLKWISIMLWMHIFVVKLRVGNRLAAWGTRRKHPKSEADEQMSP